MCEIQKIEEYKNFFIVFLGLIASKTKKFYISGLLKFNIFKSRCLSHFQFN